MDQTKRKPVGGFFSLGLFLLGPLTGWLAVALSRSDEFGGIGNYLLGLMLGGVLWLAGLIASIVGLCRSEHPRWPALLGMVLTGVAILILSTVYIR